MCLEKAYEFKVIWHISWCFVFLKYPNRCTCTLSFHDLPSNLLLWRLITCNANFAHFSPSCQLSMPAVAVQMNVFRRVTGLLTYQRAIPVTSDGCTSCILHWLAACFYLKCTLLQVYYTETEKPWNPPGPSAPPFLVCTRKASNSTYILLFTQMVFKKSFSSAHWKQKILSP